MAKKRRTPPHPIFLPFWGHFSPFDAVGQFLFFDHFLHIFGFRPIFHSTPSRLTPNVKANKGTLLLQRAGREHLKTVKRVELPHPLEPNPEVLPSDCPNDWWKCSREHWLRLLCNLRKITLTWGTRQNKKNVHPCARRFYAYNAPKAMSRKLTSHQGPRRGRTSLDSGFAFIAATLPHQCMLLTLLSPSKARSTVGLKPTFLSSAPRRRLYLRKGALTHRSAHLKPSVSKECPPDGVRRMLQVSVSRHDLLDPGYPQRESLNNVQMTVSGECCEGVLPDTVCWTRLRNTWQVSLC